MVLVIIASLAPVSAFASERGTSTLREVVQVEASVACGDEYPSGIVITNPVSNTASFFLEADVADASGNALFGDGGLLSPGESVRVASSQAAATIEDATYQYRVRQSEGVEGADSPTEPFVEVAAGSYLYDCQQPASYFLTSYDGVIWAVTADSITSLSYADWERLGFPAPASAPTDYVRYPWSSSLSAVTFFGADPSRWIWKHLSVSEWMRAGSPAPRIAGWIEGSTYYQWAGSDQVFVRDVGGVKHALSYDEWAASEFKPFERRSNQGFVKLTWDSSIAFLSDFSAGQGGPIDFATWRDEGFPRPVVQPRFPGDQVYRQYGEATVWYAGPTVNRPITYAEWSAMGRPAPEVRGTPPRPADKDCGNFTSQAAAQAEFNYYFPAYGDVHGLDGDGDGIACESHFG